MLFEIHLTSTDDSILVNGPRLDLKVISIDLLRPDLSVIQTEHMTAQAQEFDSLDHCKLWMEDKVKSLKKAGTNIIRKKIESPVYPSLVASSFYIETHFDTEQIDLPVSRKHGKLALLATAREYDKKKYPSFLNKYEKNDDLELCLYDNNVSHDFHWFEYWPIK